MEQLVLTDLVDKYILQELQDLFISKSNIAVGISGAHGEAYTEACTLSDFCERYTKQTAEGKRRCNECDCVNARNALKKNRSAAYKCHAGLTDFTAPISINGELYGFIVGGQISTEPLKKESIYALADELGIDREKYWEAAQKIKVVSRDKLDEALKTVDDISHIISDIAINKYNVLMAKEEIEAAAQMKSDFLANMSHEIRTPMNAVIGMANMALREKLPPDARSYINQIKESGNTLLAIINDILDFSKIESGKMDINLAEYSPMKLIEEVANVIITRVDDKDVELLLDVSPDMPGELMGDAVRLKQIIINLANNAVKFTREGYVRIKMTCEKKGEKNYSLCVSIEDTGIGIKKNDLEKIFDSFQQVDSKRNRNIEGTGLGLAISRQLVNLMGGSISVQSEYDVGSTFSFEVPQLALREVEGPSVRAGSEMNCIVCISNKFSRQQLCGNIEALGGNCIQLDMDELIKNLENGSFPKNGVYLFIENREVTAELGEALNRYPDVRKVVLLRFKAVCSLKTENVICIHKPIACYSLVRLFNHEEQNIFSDEENDVIDFYAPEADVLIVDDNDINLTVAKGLLEPLKMRVDTASSGEKAVSMISDKIYDIVFMDHMMPKMDGVETTHIIRRFHPEYDKVPIIALTANAMEESKAMFLCEGMNDFLAKPIEVSALIGMVKRYLPDDKILPVNTDGNVPSKTGEEAAIPQIPELNMAEAERLLGSRKLLWQIIRNYYLTIPKKKLVIGQYFNDKNWPDYTVEVHALKSLSRQIGADDIGSLAAELEMAGNSQDEELIIRDTPKLMEMYGRLYEILKPYFEEEKSGNGYKAFDKNEVMDILCNMKNAMEDLDSTAMENCIKELAAYNMSDDCRNIYDKMAEAVDNIDIDLCEKLTGEFEQLIN